MAKKEKRLTEKQRMAIELMTSGLGMRYKDIAEACGIGIRTLYSWRNDADYSHFQAELKRINDERWACLADAARASAMRLVMADNQKMTEFVLKNEGYNPTQKVDADVNVEAQVVFVDDLDEEDEDQAE